jgi:hypothetical protein
MTPGAVDLFEVKGGKTLMEWFRGSLMTASISHVAATTTQRRDIQFARVGFSLVSSNDVMSDSGSMAIDAGHSGREMDVFIVEPAGVFSGLEVSYGVAGETSIGPRICEKVQVDPAIGIESGCVVVAFCIDEACGDEGGCGEVAGIEVFDSLREIVAFGEMAYEAV